MTGNKKFSRSRASTVLRADSKAGEALKSCKRIIIFARERNNSGKFEVWLEGHSEIFLISRQPLLDAARFLIDHGCDPDAVIAKRRPGLELDDISAPVRVAARLTVDEARTAFAKWRPFPHETVSSQSDQNAVPAATLAGQRRTRQRVDRRETTRERTNPAETWKNSKNV
jgi:hypothetical protein